MELELINLELELKLITKQLNPQINLPFNFLIQKYFFHDNPPWNINYWEYLFHIGTPEYLLQSVIGVGTQSRYTKGTNWISSN